MQAPTATFSRLTPASSHTGGAVSLIQIDAPPGASEADASRIIDCVIESFGLGPIPLEIGTLRLRRLADADDVLVARPSARILHVSTHAGRAVEHAVVRALAQAGLEQRPADALDPRTLFPEARSLAEACALDTLSRAASPIAVAPVLRQVALWESSSAPSHQPATRDAAHEEARSLDRLIHPPTVAAIGPANVGKSTLLNALARAEVALTLDQPGTTLDHVGVTLTLHGVTLHWLDTPGWQPGQLPEAHAEAHALARAAVAHADLILNCADAASGFIDPSLMGAGSHQWVIRVGTRSDRGPAPHADIQTAAIRGDGIDALAEAVAGALVPRWLRESAAPPRWAFHPALRPPPGSRAEA